MRHAGNLYYNNVILYYSTHKLVLVDTLEMLSDEKPVNLFLLENIDL